MKISLYTFLGICLLGCTDSRSDQEKLEEYSNLICDCCEKIPKNLGADERHEKLRLCYDEHRDRAPDTGGERKKRYLTEMIKCECWKQIVYIENADLPECLNLSINECMDIRGKKFQGLIDRNGHLSRSPVYTVVNDSTTYDINIATGDTLFANTIIQEHNCHWISVVTYKKEETTFAEVGDTFRTELCDIRNDTLILTMTSLRDKITAPVTLVRLKN